ncbi:energy transducer TonB [Lutimaribacter sp. EGI FJ00015]|uniref:Energy transducer TonB n=1 Tax=Lutimaribacter degradans TaxID=2945989 RepID=A0ACC5ZR52_9RHOB|nr:energy transducer TonB [Lutimaribacter sp. EGI FJ00013]MCM2560592.1 energy transducer TonB [Lutimaribacter sp. EGI FJ00013]MCO0612465.1 energy transducer TonB [Lutimaribacter sp. EGI FJ00015]MCO0634416.1 energy transducer TonB [Lutimaribacter sp. EGI FJ00014]
MNLGHIISGVGHIGLIGWVLFGGAFAPAPEPFEVTEVAMISSAEFDALMSGTEPPETATDVALPTPPESDEAPAPAPARPKPRPTPPSPEAAEAPPPDAAPTPPDPEPADPTELQDEVNDLAPPPQEQAVPAPDLSDRPVPRPAPRIAPEPVAPPPPDAEVDDVVREEATPQDNADTQHEEQDATAPEEATSEIVTEAEEDPSAAPVRSLRPRARPDRPAPEPATETAATPEAETPEADGTRNAVEDALAEALGGQEAQGRSTAPTGPPMTAGERDALRVGVQRCWNVGSLSSDALSTTVVVGVDMNEDATPVTGSIRLISHSGGSAASAQQAFETARRAIIRCGVNGFDLPREKYGQWQEIEMTFDPSNMRIK